MIGRSLYISNFNDDFKIDENCDFYFTSFHIEEEYGDGYKDKAIELIEILKKHNKKIIVDISLKGLNNLGYKDFKEFVNDFDIDYIRLDYGFDNEEIIEISKYCDIAINASTFDLSLLDKLENKVMAIHNFYPRKDTGLDREYFNERNKILKENNIEIAAFISGDQLFRGPVYEGLQTLEDCRDKPPYIQYLSIRDEVDHIIVGDIGLSNYQRQLIYMSKESIIVIPAIIDDEYAYLYDTDLSNRIDSPKWLIRIKQSREYASAGKLIEPFNCIDRKKGSITIDNKNYLRYSGEIQIMKKDLCKDDRVNVIGKIKDEYLEVLDYIKNNDRFRFVK